MGCMYEVFKLRFVDASDELYYTKKKRGVPYIRNLGERAKNLSISTLSELCYDIEKTQDGGVKHEGKAVYC